jgi:hypothetical protein
VRVLVGLHHVDRVATAHALTTVDGHCEVEPLGRELGKLALHRFPLGRTRRVGQHRLVAGLGHREHRVH